MSVLLSKRCSESPLIHKLAAACLRTKFNKVIEQIFEERQKFAGSFDLNKWKNILVWTREGGTYLRGTPSAKDWYPTYHVGPSAELMNMDMRLIDGAGSIVQIGARRRFRHISWVDTATEGSRGYRYLEEQGDTNK